MAELIHGATKDNKTPALDGLFDTLQKKCTAKELGEYVLSKKPVTKYILKKNSETGKAVIYEFK